MHTEHAQDQEKLLKLAADTSQAGVSIASLLATMSRKKPLKIKMTTARDDVNTARNLLKQGTSLKEIAKILGKSDCAIEVQKAGNDAQKYARIIIQKAQMDNAVEKIPTDTLKAEKTNTNTNTSNQQRRR